MTRAANRMLIFVTILIPLILSACAKHEVSIAKSGAVGRMAEIGAVEADRLHAATATQRVEVKDVEAAARQVESLVQKSGGYVQTQSIREEERAFLVLRVLASQMQPMLNATAALGTEESRSVSSEDVTGQYIDTEARLKNAVALRDRLKSLLRHAKNVKDILEIEKELTRVQGDIDSMDGRMKKLKGRVDFAEIDLTLDRKTTLGPLGYIVYGVAWLVKKLFVID